MFYFSLYFLTIGGRKRRLNLSDINGNDVYEMLKEIFLSAKEKGGIFKIENSRKGINISHVDFDDSERIVYGILEKGVYGTRTRIIDVETGEQTHEKGRNEMEGIPFYYLFYIPQNHDRGICIFEKIRNDGIADVVDKFLKENLKKKINKGVYLSGFMLGPVLEEILEGRLFKVRLIKYSLNPDIAEAYDRNEDEGEMELVIKAKRNGYLPIEKVKSFLKKIINDKSDDYDFYEILPPKETLETMGFDDVDDVKLEFRIGHHQRTIPIKSILDIRSDIILDGLEMGDDGFPKLQSLHSKAMAYLNILREIVYGA